MVVMDLMIWVIKMERRKCMLCGGENTRKRKHKNGNTYEEWCKYKGGFICGSCSKLQSAKIRNGKLSKYSETGKGFISEQLVAKYLGIDNCNIKNNSLHSSVDLFHNDKYKRIDVKSCKLTSLCGDCYGWNFTLGKHKPDNYFLLCFDENRKRLLHVFVIPGSTITNTFCISISVGNLLRYYRYKLDNTEVEKLNDVLHSLGKNGSCEYILEYNKKEDDVLEEIEDEY